LSIYSLKQTNTYLTIISNLIIIININVIFTIEYKY